MRLLTKFIISSVAVLAVVIGILAFAGFTAIDRTVNRNNMEIMRLELQSAARELARDPAEQPWRNSELAARLTDIQTGTDRVFYAVRPDGTHIFPKSNLPSAPTAETTRSLVDARAGSGWIDAVGGQYLSRYVTLPEQNLLLGIGIPEETVYGGRIRYLSAVSGAALLLLIIGVTVAYYVSRRLTRRIDQTLNALESIGEGEYGVWISDADGTDELSAIQRQINDMADAFARRSRERDAATKWLEENEERFRNFAETASDAFWETDEELRYTFFVNPGRDFGMAQEDNSIIGQKRGEYFTHDATFYGEVWRQHMQDLADRKVVRNFAFSGVYPDGTTFSRTSSAIPIFDQDGNFKGYRGSTTDVTDRIEAERKLQNLVENLPGLVFQRLVYPDDRIDYSYFSSSAAKFFGGTTETENIEIARDHSPIHPDDGERATRTIIDNARAGTGYTIEFRTILPSGEVRWIRTVCSPPSRRPDGVLVQDGASFDITDLKTAEEEAQQAEARLTDFMQAGFDVLWETDTEHRVSWMSDPVDGENRFYNASKMIGKRRWEFPGVKPADSEAWQPLIKAMNAGEPFRDFEFESVLEDGRSVYRRVSGRPTYDENGDFAGYRGISSNITASVSRELESQAARDRLIAAIESSDQGVALYGPDDRLIFANKACLALDGDFAGIFVPGRTFEEVVLKAIELGDFPAAHGDEDNWFKRRMEYHRNPVGSFGTVLQGDTYLDIREERLEDGSSITRMVDVTEHYRARTALQESEERFRDFAVSTSDWMWESDREHRVIWVSEGVTRHSDIEIESMMGQTRWDRLGIDLETDENWRGLVETMDTRERVRDFHYSRTDDSGNLLHRNMNAVPIFDEAGDFKGYRGSVTDTTGLIEAEQAEKRFLDAMNSADEGLILLDSKDFVVFANRQARILLGGEDAVLTPGMPFEQVLRTNLPASKMQITEDEWEEWLRGRMGTHRNMDAETPIITRRSNGMVVETREGLLPDGSCIIFLNDITARTETEEALRVSRQRFQDFTQSSSDWLWETDADFRFTMTEGGIRGSSELDPDGFIGKTRWEFYGIDMETDENWRAHLDDMLARKPFRDFRYSRISPDGRIMHRSVNGIPYYDPSTGDFLGYRGTTADITEQVEAEDRYRKLIEQSPAPIVVHRDDTFVFANAAAVELFGAENAEQVLATGVLDLVHPDERESFLVRREQIEQDGDVTPVIEQRRLRMDGSEVVVMSRGVPVLWEGERAVLGSLIDVTDRIEAERQYRELIENAPMAISIDDGEKFQMVNQAFADMFAGGSPNDIAGRPITDMAHSDDLEEFENRVRTVSFYRKMLPTTEIRRKRFDGREITVLTRGVPIMWQGLPATLGIQVDISDRIETQQALRDSEERYRNLVEGSRQGVLLHADFKPVFVNAMLAEMFGYDSEEEMLALTNVLDLVAPEAREKWRTNREARLAGLDVENDYEFPGLRKDGSRIWLHMSVRVVSWDDKTAIQGTMVDVTRRREAEIRIRESEEQFRLLTSTSPVGIFVANSGGDFEYVNEAYEEMTGRSLQELTGQGWTDALHPEDRDRVLAEWAEGRDSDGPYRTEFRFLRPDGKITWGIAQAIAQRNPAGEPLRFIGAITDVSARVQAEEARQRSEELFRTLTTLSPVGVFLTDSNGRVEYVNDSLSEMLGMSAEEAFGAGWIEGIDEEDRSHLLDAWRQANKSRRGMEMELRMNTQTGVDARWAFVQASPLTADGSAGGFIGAVTDITERRQAEEQLRQAQKMDAVGQLTGGIAHDFNNLLAIVQGNLELLQERAPDDARLSSLIEAAHGAAKRGASLNQRLLAFARRQPLRPSVCDINEIVGDMAGLFMRTLGDNIELNTRFAEGLWVANIDPNGLETAVLNLAINSRDAMPDGGRLTITTSNISFNENLSSPGTELTAGDYVALTVADTGTGMDDETLEKAFDPFYTTKSMGKGSGLGLSMVYGFARQSGGTTVIESVQGQGTSITLYFPRDYADVDERQETSAALPPAGGGECILVVEDDEDVREMAIGMFESLNYKTLVAGSATEALEILSNGDDIELLFTDVMLGAGDNGPELARKARLLDPGLRVLFASGYAGSEIDEGKSIELGALINKPYERVELARAVRTALETGRA